MPPKKAAGGAKGLGADGRGALLPRRPKQVRDAGAKFFEQQSTAGKDKAYGAVGNPDYVIESRKNLFEMEAIMGIWDVVASFEKPSELRILDLGTGDGTLLYGLHRRFGIPWENLLGISAEDMRGLGLPVIKDVLPFDLREIQEADASYTVWNIEDLDNCNALKGRSFDLVVSFVTFCWLTDPFGALEVVHDRFLTPGGLLMVGSLQLQVVDVAVIDDQCYLAALRDRLQEEGHSVQVLRDPMSTFFSLWLQRKVKDSLQLWPLLDYGTVPAGTSKVEYNVSFSPASELPQFDLENVTVVQVDGPRLGLTGEMVQLAEALFRMLDLEHSGEIRRDVLATMGQPLIDLLDLKAPEPASVAPLNLAAWMERAGGAVARAGWKEAKSVCTTELIQVAQQSAERIQEEEYREAAGMIFTRQIQDGPLWMCKCLGIQAARDGFPDLDILRPLWKAVWILLGETIDKEEQISLARYIQQPMANYRKFRDSLESLGNSVCSGKFWGRWDSEPEMKKDLEVLLALMSEEAPSFDEGVYKGMLWQNFGIRRRRKAVWTMVKSQGLSNSAKEIPQGGTCREVLLATECLRVWVREVVKNMKERAFCFLATVTLDSEDRVVCTSMAGEEIVPALPSASLTLGNVRAAVCRGAKRRYVKLLSADGRVLDSPDDTPIVEALRPSDENAEGG